MRAQLALNRNDIALLSNYALAIASSSSFDTNDNGNNELKIFFDIVPRDNGIYDNVSNNNHIGVVPRVHGSLLESAKKHVCDLCTVAQDFVWDENRKEAQPIDLKLSSEFNSSTSLTDTNAQLIMEALAEDWNSAPYDFYHGAVFTANAHQLTSHD